MTKRILIISSLLLLLTQSCIYIPAGLSKGDTGRGPKNYQYKCQKAGDCCEVGKDCKEEK